MTEKKKIKEQILFEFYAKKIKIIFVITLPIVIVLFSFAMVGDYESVTWESRLVFAFCIIIFLTLFLREFLLDRTKPTLVFSDIGIYAYPQYTFLKRDPHLFKWKEIEDIKLKYVGVGTAAIHLDIKLRETGEEISLLKLLKEQIIQKKSIIQIEPVYKEKADFIIQKARECLNEFGKK